MTEYERMYKEWQEKRKPLEELKEYIDACFQATDKDDNSDAWEEFVSKNFYIGFGNKMTTVDNGAEVFSAFCDCIDRCLDDIDDDWKPVEKEKSIGRFVKSYQFESDCNGITVTGYLTTGEFFNGLQPDYDEADSFGLWKSRQYWDDGDEDGYIREITASDAKFLMMWMDILDDLERDEDSEYHDEVNAWKECVEDMVISRWKAEAEKVNG